jgi:hypothetical protein
MEGFKYQGSGMGFDYSAKDIFVWLPFSGRVFLC